MSSGVTGPQDEPPTCAPTSDISMNDRPKNTALVGPRLGIMVPSWQWFLGLYLWHYGKEVCHDHMISDPRDACWAKWPMSFQFRVFQSATVVPPTASTTWESLCFSPQQTDFAHTWAGVAQLRAGRRPSGVIGTNCKKMNTTAVMVWPNSKVSLLNVSQWWTKSQKVIKNILPFWTHQVTDPTETIDLVVMHPRLAPQNNAL